MEARISNSSALVPRWSARNFARSTMQTFFHAWSVAWRYDLLQAESDRFSDLMYTGGMTPDDVVENFPWSIVGYNEMDASNDECRQDE